MKNTKQEYNIIVDISKKLESQYQKDSVEWEKSYFAWLRDYPSGRKGAIGKKLVTSWLKEHSFNVQKGLGKGSGVDRIVEGKCVAIKTSTPWQNNGGYTFQQLRDQKYDLVICLGLSPFDAHCWVIPKDDVLRLWKKEGKIKTQHGGKKGADTAWINFQANSPPKWLAPFGGSLSEGLAKLSKITGFEIKQDEPVE